MIKYYSPCFLKLNISIIHCIPRHLQNVQFTTHCPTNNKYTLGYDLVAQNRKMSHPDLLWAGNNPLSSLFWLRQKNIIFIIILKWTDVHDIPSLSFLSTNENKQQNKTLNNFSFHFFSSLPACQCSRSTYILADLFN